MTRANVFRTFFSTFLLFTGFYFGTLYGKAKVNMPLCATYSEKNMELEVSAIYALSSDHNILGMLSEEDVKEMQKDSRLVFHACRK